MPHAQGRPYLFYSSYRLTVLDVAPGYPRRIALVHRREPKQREGYLVVCPSQPEYIWRLVCGSLQFQCSAAKQLSTALGRTTRKTQDGRYYPPPIPARCQRRLPHQNSARLGSDLWIRVCRQPTSYQSRYLGQFSKPTGTLAEKSIDHSYQDDRGRTPLIYSVSKRLTSLTKVLLDHTSPHVDLRDTEGRTALWNATQHGNKDAMQLLLESGSDVHAADIYGVTTLNKSIVEGNLSTFQALLRYLGHSLSALALNGNGGFRDNQPSLCLAGSRGNSDIVPLLLSHALDVNMTNGEGQTPLHLAVEHGHQRVVKVLLN